MQPLRTRQLAAIHVQKQRLRLDDALYRDVLESLTGKRSAAELDDSERARVLDDLRRRSGDAAKRMRQALPAPPRVREELQAMMSKIAAIADELDLSWAYIDGMAKRMFNVHKAAWLRSHQCHRLVAALNYHQQRKRKRSAGQR